MLDIFELESCAFENAIEKNKRIQLSSRDWIGFVDSSVTDKEEICNILDEMHGLSEYDAILFGEDCPDGETDLSGLLEYPNMAVYAFLVRRAILVKTGAFNLYLTGNNNYEFLLRVAESGRLYAITCHADKKETIDAFTMAYIMRRYMPLLKEEGRLDEVFLHMVHLSKTHGISMEFNNAMNRLISDLEEYEQIERNTAPVLVFVGDNLCAGVLAGFANSLADELVGLGQAVITTNSKYGNYSDIPTDVLLKQNYKAIIGFQSPALCKEMFLEMKGKKIQFWLDNPAFLESFFEEGAEQICFLCQDKYYADFIKEYYDVPQAIHFPPGGVFINDLPTGKKYDVVFVGNYEPLPECIYEDEYEMVFFNYMIQHPDSTFEHGLHEYGIMRGEVYGKKEILQLLHRMKQVCLDVLHRDRHYIIEKILSSGIQLHVFSDNWKMYHGKGYENLIIHPMIFEKEPFKVWAQAKIGLNIMRGHKAGMTERIANIMLCGTCCLSDETQYLNEHFTDGEDIVLFNRKELQDLPKKILYLLEHDEERERIALAGKKRALREHTWRVRAEKLLELLDA